MSLIHPTIRFFDRITTEVRKDNSMMGKQASVPQYCIVHHGLLHNRLYYIRACRNPGNIIYDISFNKNERISIIASIYRDGLCTTNNIYAPDKPSAALIDLFDELLEYIVMDARANCFKRYSIQFVPRLVEWVAPALEIQSFIIGNPLAGVCSAMKELEPLVFPPCIQFEKNTPVRYIHYQGRIYFISRAKIEVGNYLYVIATEGRSCEVTVTIDHRINFTGFNIQTSSAEVLQALIEHILIDSLMVGARECFSTVPGSLLIKQAMEGAGMSVFPVNDEEMQLCVRV